MSEPVRPVAQDVPASHPIRLVVTDDLKRSRLTVFFRLLLVIPHAIVLALWGIAVWLLAVVAWVICVFTGRLPDSLHGFFGSFVTYSTQVSAYASLASDPFPAFGGRPGYPVDLEIAPAQPQSRLTALFRLLLAIPAFIVLYVLQLVAQVVSFLAWFYALFTGRMNKGMRDLLAYRLRYEAQTYAYLLFLTGRYPSFSDE